MLNDAIRQAWFRRRDIARAYKNLFLAPDNKTPAPLADKVLADLKRFCYAGTSCVIRGENGQIDTHATAVAEGRREVWLRIQEHLCMDDQTIHALGDDHV